MINMQIGYAEQSDPATVDYFRGMDEAMRQRFPAREMLHVLALSDLAYALGPTPEGITTAELVYATWDRIETSDASYLVKVALELNAPHENLRLDPLLKPVDSLEPRSYIALGFDRGAHLDNVRGSQSRTPGEPKNTVFANRNGATGASLAMLLPERV